MVTQMFVSNRLRYLHQVIRKAFQEQYIREDPFDFIDIETRTYERNVLTSDELHKHSLDYQANIFNRLILPLYNL